MNYLDVAEWVLREKAARMGLTLSKEQARELAREVVKATTIQYNVETTIDTGYLDAAERARMVRMATDRTREKMLRDVLPEVWVDVSDTPDGILRVRTSLIVLRKEQDEPH